MLTTPLFLKLKEVTKKIIILQGGGDAGKTVTALQYLGDKARYQKNLIITVTANSLPNLKRGALTSFKRYVLPYVKDHVESYNKQENTYYFKNGSIIEFKSFNDELDARGSERDYLFMNEANSQQYSMFWQLNRKTRIQTILDYNPTSTFWVHTNIIEGGEAEYKGTWKYFQLDHRHNPFLPADVHNSYESMSDPDLFKVYARGETGKVSGLIFGHFVAVESMPTDCERYIWGIDYGYTNDPTAIVKVGIKGRERYYQEICYEPGLSAIHIKQLMDNAGRKPNETLYSEIDNEMILQLRKLGVSVTQAKKGPGSRVAGISKMKEFASYYIGPNFDKEIMNYKYVTVTDSLTGKTILTNEPMDGNDHLCQAATYATYTDTFYHRAGY
jgi:phage terminase large subunit